MGATTAIAADVSRDQGNYPLDVSIIIATYNARELLLNCLASIYDHPPKVPFEVIVYDDASKDGTTQAVSAQFPQVRLYTNEVNVHYATSNNRAFRVAQGRFYFLLNSDTLVMPDAIDLMVRFLCEHPDAGAVGSKLLNEDGTLQLSVKSLPSIGSALFGLRSFLFRWFPTNRFTRAHLPQINNDIDVPCVAGYVSSAAVMIPREVVERVGDLDRRLSYHVDADYSKRISDLGLKNYYLPTARIVHLNHRGGTMVSFRRRFRSLVEFHRGSYIYYVKHVRWSRWSPMQIVVIGGLAARFILSLGGQLVAEVYDMGKWCLNRKKEIR
ncbi:MAG TPA: glycosyltransferase family 2 protein [Candidatus Binataceae bacterium]|nr:glycosyltransferase family 2 protein [Candidatus Binataceae bacterium]